jgi:pantoate--beta-alanine ligase
MIVAQTPTQLREALRDRPRPLGVVLTMGALHAGHLALIARARAECATVGASIFVNPLQFGPNEDFARYPRALPNDLAAFERAGVDVAFTPDVDTMYPAGFATSVDPGPVGERFEGALRPGHFRGVATVCTKLFSLFGAERVYFGAKDAQQVAALRRVVGDLALPTEVIVVPTVRESDGLALSSRNAYLSTEERSAAPALHRALDAIVRAVRDGDGNRESVLARGRGELVVGTREAYLDLVDPLTFEAVDPAAPQALAIGSVWLGTTRILDNEAVRA